MERAHYDWAWLWESDWENLLATELCRPFLGIEPTSCLPVLRENISQRSWQLRVRKGAASRTVAASPDVLQPIALILLRLDHLPQILRRIVAGRRVVVDALVRFRRRVLTLPAQPRRERATDGAGLEYLAEPGYRSLRRLVLPNPAISGRLEGGYRRVDRPPSGARGHVGVVRRAAVVGRHRSARWAGGAGCSTDRRVELAQVCRGAVVGVTVRRSRFRPGP